MTQYSQNPQNDQRPQPHLPDPYPQPPKRHIGRNVILVLVGLVILVLIGGVAIIGGAVNKANASHVVVYKITGTSQAASLITYTTDGAGTTEQFDNAKIPWAKTFTIKGGAVYQVIAQNRSDQTGTTVTCTIEVDGVVVKTATGDGEFTIAHCVATP